MLLFKKIILATLMILVTIGAYAQIEVDKSIIITHPNDSGRVINSGYPTSSGTSLNAKTIQENKLNYFKSFGTSSIYLQPSLPDFTLQEGTVIYFKLKTISFDTLKVTVDSINYFAVFDQVLFPVRSIDLDSGMVLSIVFSGNKFMLLNKKINHCPPGFEKINEQYCIEKAESASVTTFFLAVSSCQNKGARLCTWAEWYYACSIPNSPMLSSIDNWEYIDDAANEIAQVRVVGLSACTAAEIHNVNTSFNKKFRCCYTLK